MISFDELLTEPGRPIPLEVKDGWARWAMYSCEERGGHWWQMEIELGSVHINCTHCPADGHEFYPDLVEVLYMPPTPVALELDVTKYSGGWWGSDEYDVSVNVSPR